MIRCVILSLICGSYATKLPPTHLDYDELNLHPLNVPNYKEYVEKYNEAEENAQYWRDQAQIQLERQLSRVFNTGVAKNVILFIGDGMSIPTTTAARIHLGQRKGQTGEETQLSFDTFPYIGLSKTYCVDKQVADSACSATAYLGGVKGNRHTIGVSAAVKVNDCVEMNKEINRVKSIAYYAQKQNKRTGFVTTTKVTHASPAGVYGHTANRMWEDDLYVKLAGKDSKVCHDLAQQLIYGEIGKNLNVIFGGGRKKFFPFYETDEDHNHGDRFDSRNLIKEWNSIKNHTTHQYVRNREEFLNISNNVDYVLGLFDGSHMSYNLERDEKKQPSLSEMTQKAIDLLANGDEGYFLFVEGGRIDMAHHKSEARKALDETIELHKAVNIALNITSSNDTLIIVTADHSHTMNINGYPERGADVLGIGGWGIDFKRYTTISYANGPGYRKEVDGRYDPSKDNLTDIDYRYPSLVPLISETHGGDDVAIYARGPWAHLFSGVVEQNFIHHAINFAACIGPEKTTCN
ncbi:hypothetical protein FQA39_LY08201 [Lamprigera yunnana]|nr:hypothetical protein FQA39_LY08201 [Lamprigera yunnana]